MIVLIKKKNLNSMYICPHLQANGFCASKPTPHASPRTRQRVSRAHIEPRTAFHLDHALPQLVANRLPGGPAPWRPPETLRLVLSYAPGLALPGCEQPPRSGSLQVDVSTIASLLVLPEIHAPARARGLGCSGGARAAAWCRWLEGRGSWAVLTAPSAATCITGGSHQ